MAAGPYLGSKGVAVAYSVMEDMFVTADDHVSHI